MLADRARLRSSVDRESTLTRAAHRVHAAVEERLCRNFAESIGLRDRSGSGRRSLYRLDVGKLDGGSSDFQVDDPATRLVAQTTGVPAVAGATAVEHDAPSESASELNLKLTNPVSDLWSLSNQFNNFKLANGHWNNNWNFQPVLPLSLTKDWNLITRLVMPFSRQRAWECF